ncbi:MAG: Pyrimidine 5'-nucleotidase YjjG [bacterium ADurb.Bin212]|nr:MAG: Pyrimidine 5'-nucleotidase YjjG [bacterium ADurb.Bin212]
MHYPIKIALGQNATIFPKINRIAYNVFMNKIDWIFFDVGGVLIEDDVFEETRRSLLLRTLRVLDSSITESNLDEMMLKASSMTGPINDNVLNLFIRDKQKLYIARNFLAGRKNELNEAAAENCVRKEAKIVLGKLAKKYQLGLIANQPTANKILLEEAGVSKFLNHFLVSQEHGFGKPDLRYFQSVFNATKANPQRSVMVDNNIERGLHPAKRLKMTTVWFNAHKKEVPDDNNVDFTVNNLQGLLDLFC